VFVQRPGATTYSFPNYRELRDRNDVFSGLASYRITVIGLDTGGMSERVWGYLATGNYFDVLGTTPHLGRYFGPAEDHDRGGSAYAVITRAAPSVAIINETLARKLFGTADAAGRRFRTGRAAPLTQVIGIVEDGKYTHLIESPRSALFWPSAQRYNGTTVLLARTSGFESQTAAELRRALSSLDASVAVYGVGSLNQMLGFAYFPARAATVALTVFGILAIMLAATGIYGMAAYAISRRSREIGIRTAIGAQRRDILNLVLGRTSILLLIGSIGGLLLGTAVAGPLLAKVVYQASARDPFVIAAVPLTMALIGILAALGPARRAVKIDPVVLLRNE
jgi:ABC-type antimicrobial peptide transport system permease subunit